MKTELRLARIIGSLRRRTARSRPPEPGPGASAIASCLLLVGCALGALAGDAPGLIGAWPYGPAREVAIDGSTAYVSTGTILQVVDASVPGSMVVLAEIDVGATVSDIEVAGNHLLAVDRDFTLLVFDVFDPASPTLATRFDLPDGIVDIAVSGAWAYGVGPSAHLQILDISDPASPSIDGSLGGLTTPQSVDALGTTLFVGDGLQGLVTVDASLPSDPSMLGFSGYTAPEILRGSLAVSGDTVFAGAGQQGLVVFDVSDPTQPVEIARLDPPGLSHEGRVAVDGDLAVVTDLDRGLQVVDVHDPADPQETGVWATEHAPADVELSDGVAFVANDGGGLAVVGVGLDGTASLLGHADTPARSRDVALDGEFAYVANGLDGVRVLDISDPSAPVEIAVHDTPGSAHEVAVSGHTLVVADGAGGLRIVDVAAPSTPVELGAFNPEEWVTNVEVDGSVAVAVGAYGTIGALWTVDLSDPADPTELGRLERTHWHPAGIAISHHRAYVSCSSLGLTVVDLADPTQPRWVGFTVGPAIAGGVAMANGFGYVADHGGGLWVYDVESGDPPLEVAVAAPNTPYGDLAIRTDRLIAVGRYGMQVFDLASPASPMLVHRTRTLDQPLGVVTTGDAAIIADGDVLLTIMRPCALFCDDFEWADVAIWSEVVGLDAN